MTAHASDDALIADLARALGHELSLVAEVHEGRASFIVAETAGTRTWRLECSPSELADAVRDRTVSGREAGVGYADPSRGASPGAALLAIHLSEAIATAGPSARRLVVDRGGVRGV